MDSKIAVCPGSFDPITVGHLDIIMRASKLFDHVVVAVMSNDSKKCSFSNEERVKLIKDVIDFYKLDNVSVEYSNMLLADYAKEKKETTIVKGLRAVSDFEYEFQMALTNKKLNPDADTVFLTSTAENMFLSSSVVKLIASRGGDISGFVPDVIHDYIKSRLQRKGEN